MPNYPFEERYAAPTYSESEVGELRIKQLHFLTDHMLLLLSDDKILCVPLTATLAEASREDRYQWQLVEEGHGVLWHTESLEESLNLRSLVEHPEARVADLAGSAHPFPPLRIS